MKTVIQFTKIRYIMFIISAILIIGGFSGLFTQGFNLGIDFTGGINKQFQITPVAFNLQYSGEGYADANIAFNTLEVKISGREIIPIFDFNNYKTISELATDINKIEGLTAELEPGVENLPVDSILSFIMQIDITNTQVPVNYRLINLDEIFTSITSVRESLEDLNEYGKFDVQLIGETLSQEYSVKIQVSLEEEENKELLDVINTKMVELLETSFGNDTVVMKKEEFVHSLFSLNLTQGAIWSIIVAFILILIYITVRFKFVYALAAIIALIHDVCIMLGIIATFQLEVTSATVAAVLTIIGYSLNDTIVVFDRVRENFALMPEAKRDVVINTSITQSLGRTTITSLTTLLAVVSIYIFGTGVIKDFAFNLIIGVVVGTYSSIFIASPVVLGWQNAIERRKKAKESKTREIKDKKDKVKAAPVQKPKAVKANTDEVVNKQEKPVKKKKKKKKKKKR